MGTFFKSKLTALSIKQKVILFFVSLTLVNLIIIVLIVHCYSSNSGYLENLARKNLNRAGVDVGEQDTDTKGNENIVTATSNVLKQNPRDVDALQQRAEALVALDEPEKALADYERLIGLEPKVFSWHKGKAEQLRSLKRYKDAVVEDGVLFDLQKNADNILLRAHDNIDAGDRNRAVKDLEASVSLPPFKDPKIEDFVDTTDKTRAELYRKLNMPDKFFYFIDKFIAECKKTDYGPAGKREKLNYEIELEQYDKALTDLDQGDYNDSRKAALLLVTGKEREAMKIYQTQLDELTKQFKSKDVKNSQYDNVRQCNDALILYKRLHPGQDYTAFARDCANRAESILTDPRNEDPNPSAACDLLENLPPELGRELAKKMLPILEKSDKVDDQQFALRTLVYLGDQEAADKLMLKHSMDQDAKDKDSHYYHKLADTQLSIGRNKKALESARKAIELDRHASCGWMPMARAAQANGDWKEAQKYFDMVKNDSEFNGESNNYDSFLQSQIMAARGDKAGAAKYLRLAAAMNEDQAIDAFLSKKQH